MDIKRIVNCTPEQFEALHREGQVEVDGEVKTKEDGVLYNPGELPLLEWYNKVMAEELGRNKVAHAPFIVKSLEQYREDIIADPSNEITADNSAVGFSAVLKQGDIVPVHTNTWSFTPGDDNVGLCFINGKEAKETYTHTSEHEELVRVWYFATGKLDINLTYAPPYFPYEFALFSKDGYIGTIESDYYAGVRVLIQGSSGLNSFSSASDVTVKGVTDVKCSAPQARTFYHEGVTIPARWEGLAKNKRLKNAVFPNLKTIEYNTLASGSGGYTFGNCTNENLTIAFPQLVEVKGANMAGAAPFWAVKFVTIPNSVRILGNNCFYQTPNIELKCNTAQTIDPNWCATTPAESFSMCKEWRTSINIATAAKGLWDAERMRDFLENYLADLYDYAPEYSGGAGAVIGAELTIPQDILTTLEEKGEDGEVVEENGETRKGCLLIAEEKGWIIGGA